MSQSRDMPAPSGPDDSGIEGVGHGGSRPDTGLRTLGRRSLILAGLGLLAGCATRRPGRSMPGAIWPEPRPIASGGTSVPPTPTPASGSGLPGVLPRSNWAFGNPIVSRVDRMTPPRFITIHHDGMRPFYGTGTGEVAGQIERIRSIHVGDRGWGDIGYHFVVDRAGRIWEARPIRYQGAHVQLQNPGNIGILCLGNFEQQSPSPQQLSGLGVLVSTLSARHRIPEGRILTHREWSTARTLCPGRNLQSEIDRMRRTGALA